MQMEVDVLNESLLIPKIKAKVSRNQKIKESTIYRVFLIINDVFRT